MTDTPAATIPAYLRLARLLDAGLFAQTPSDAFKALLPQTDQDWLDLFQVARNNRAIAPLAFMFSCKPDFAALLEAEELGALTEWHELLDIRTRAIHVQLIEFTNMYRKNGQDLLLLKGASRLFDDLYPDPSCRFSADVDLMVKNPDLYYKSFDLGYEIPDDAAFDIKAVRAGDLSCALTPNFHHLPALYKPGDQVGIELHLYPFARIHDDLAIPNLWQDSRPVAGAPGLLIPSVSHQIIINIVHTLLHGLAKESFSLSIRDLYEGHLLYLGASPKDRDAARSHFSTRGYRKDFELWQYICHRFFENPVYSGVQSRFNKQFFDRLAEVQMDPAALFKYRLRSKIRNFFVLELTSWRRLKIRFQHLRSAAFWRRVKNSVLNARSGRQ